MVGPFALPFRIAMDLTGEGRSVLFETRDPLLQWIPGP
jgi:hypothetical protein